MKKSRSDKKPRPASRTGSGKKPYRAKSYGGGDKRAKDAAPTKPKINYTEGFVIGITERRGSMVIVRPVSRRDNAEYQLIDGKKNQTPSNHLVKIKLTKAGKSGAVNLRGELAEDYGSAEAADIFSLIAIHAYNLPHVFPPAALAEANKGEVPALGKRTDLRDVPFVTIDGEDARDFDDAVFAAPDPDHPGGWHLKVAIADVSYYVRPGSALDKEAFVRGNSVYLPDRVVPMLPEALSNDLCSLRPHTPRAALVADLWIDAHGNLKKFSFCRALIRSVARLTYNQVQAVHETRPDDTTLPLMDLVIRPLYAAYACLLKARLARGTLDLDVPERKVIFGADGKVEAIGIRPRFDSHRLIEEFMIAANVAAAKQLTAKNAPCLFRVHELPDQTKLDAARDVLKAMGLNLVKGTPRPMDFMQLIKQSADRPDAQLVHQIILRSQSQAIYSPNNIGHFGLALSHYAHFTSPIRRYADLIVHRSLIASLGLGQDGISAAEAHALDKIAIHIGVTERRAMEAERSTMDRYQAALLAGQEGAIFSAKISSVTRFGLFVSLDETGADGIVPMRSLTDDFYIFDAALQRLRGKTDGNTYILGQPVMVKLVEVSAVSGSLMFHIVPLERNPAGRRFLRKKLD